MEKINENAIIARIRTLRIQHSGLRGKSKFARALDISPSTYSYYENNRVPPIEILLAICELTGADLFWLLTGDKNRQTPYFASVSNPGLFRQLDELLSKHPETAVSKGATADQPTTGH